MGSPLPKVLHPVAGKPMVVKVIQACQNAGVENIRVVVGHGSSLVHSVIEPYSISTHTQFQQAGTADAVRAAQIEDLSGDIIILYGDVPLITAEDIQSYVEQFRAQSWDLALVTCSLKKPGDLGRVVRHQGQLRAIVEAKDASAETLKIKEINTGIYIVQSEILQDYLPRINNHNVKGEYYLTDLISLAVEDHGKVGTLRGNPRVAFGVNSQLELARANRWAFRNKAKQLMDSGVLMLDPWSAFIEEDVVVKPGAVLHSHIHLRGKTEIGSFTSIEPNCYIRDSQIGESVTVRANSYFENCKIANRASVGPFARLRPETEIGEEAHVGNFVEMKKVKFGAKSKAGHLTYLGDAEIGIDTNIGCGTITCNYAIDHKKYKTKIGDNVFVGSDSQFVAPITVGDRAIIGSGSTITEDVPADMMAIARGRQVLKNKKT